MSLTTDDIRRIASLSRLALTDDQIEQYTPEVAAVLEAMEQLQTVPTDNVTPADSRPVDAQALRADEVVSSSAAAGLLANAPETAGDFVKVREGTFTHEA